MPPTLETAPVTLPTKSPSEVTVPWAGARTQAFLKGCHIVIDPGHGGSDPGAERAQ